MAGLNPRSLGQDDTREGLDTLKPKPKETMPGSNLKRET